MTVRELCTFIDDIRRTNPTNVMSIYFVRRSGTMKYKSYQPQISQEVQHDILNMILPNLRSQLLNNRLVQYNPTGVADGEIEELEQQEVPYVTAFLNSVTSEELLLNSGNLDLAKIAFYCIKIAYNNSEVFLFRQFSKLRKLRKGYIARILNDELIAMEKEFIGIDESTDIILAQNSLLILNHIYLERVFNYRDQYRQKTMEAMGELLNQDVLENIEQFSHDCERDVRAMKRFTDIMTNGRMPLFFENYEKVPGIVSELGIDLQFNDEGKIIYRDKSQLFPLIYLMSDAYFKSLLAERTGIAKLEEAVN